MLNLIATALATRSTNYTVPVSLASIGSLLLGVAATYFVAKRKNSGSVNTSEPDELWKEGRALRGELRETVEKQNKKIEDQDKRITLLMSRVRQLESVMRDAKLEVPSWPTTTGS
jgi:phosphoketolase